MSTNTDLLSLLRDEGLHLLMLMACPEGIVVSNAHGKIVLFSGRAESLFDYSPIEVMGKPPRMLFAAPTEYDEFTQRLRETKTVTAHGLTAKKKDGDTFPAAISGSMLFDRLGEELATVVYVRDHTAFQSIEDALRQNNQRLNTLVEELGHVASHDQLTGLLNRASAMQRAEAALLAGEGRQPFGVAVMDIDHFKRVNDSYGHLVGDMALAEFAAVMRRATRGDDIIGRFGGEEFIAFLPGSNMESTIAFAERVRKAIERARLHVDDLTLTLTVSAGVASIPESAESINEAIRLADNRLLLAKRQGRNRVISDDGRVTMIANREAA